MLQLIEEDEALGKRLKMVRARQEEEEEAEKERRKRRTAGRRAEESVSERRGGGEDGAHILGASRKARAEEKCDARRRDAHVSHDTRLAQ